MAIAFSAVTSPLALEGLSRAHSSRVARHESSRRTPGVAGAPAISLTAGAAILALGRGSSRRKGQKHRLQFVPVRAAAEVKEEKFQVGATVKVLTDDIIFWHVPGSKGKAYNPQGLEGEVRSIIEDEHLTANRPIFVKLSKAPADKADGFKAFNAHFAAHELCLSSEEDSAASPNTVEKESSTEAAKDTALAMDSASLNIFEDERWVINLLYDGQCPSCMKQVEFLVKRMDENPEYQGLVRLTDLHSEDYDPEACGGVVFEDGMRHIHAVTRDGEVIVGMDVFRRIYSIVGMQWVYDITTLPIVGSFFDVLYDWFSEYRLKAAGREDILESVHNHQRKIQELSEAECEVECEVDWDAPDLSAQPARIARR
mmetsp:Transcript_19610/g.34681  ORF Transcript_19610/g.34681 Transcript_19610/m.34681 type:complete len:370 (-) Transcript_19610:54-1163(-)